MIKKRFTLKILNYIYKLQNIPHAIPKMHKIRSNEIFSSFRGDSLLVTETMSLNTANFADTILVDRISLQFLNACTY